jgi:hypothetical protein
MYKFKFHVKKIRIHEEKKLGFKIITYLPQMEIYNMCLEKLTEHYGSGIL